MITMIKQTLEKLANRKTLNAPEAAKLLSDLVNGSVSSSSYTEIAKKLQVEHRYLQGQIFTLLTCIIRENANAFNEDRYDGRNEYAVKLSAELQKTIENFTCEFTR